MGRWGQNAAQGILNRFPKNQNNSKKDEVSTVKLVSSDTTNGNYTDTDSIKILDNGNENQKVNQQQTNNNERPRLRALANTGGLVLQGGGRVLQVVLRRNGRNNQQSPQDRQSLANNADPNAPKEEPKPCPKETLRALHNACSNQSAVSAIQYLVARHPEGAAATQDGNLPLHTACARRAPISVIEYLIQEFPEGTGVRNKRYKLPIHVALECGACLDVIKLLVNHDPESLHVADYDIASQQFQHVWIVHSGKVTMDNRTGLPLHYACKFLASLHTIHYLITEYPDAARTKNKDGWLPVHYSCARGAPLQVVQYLMTSCPSSLYERTFLYYEYPMHLAAGRPNANLNVVKYLQSRHSIAVTQTKPNEGLYLTYYDEACLQSAPPPVIWFLSDVCAKASQGYAFLADAEDPYN